ncbi:Tmc1 protein [Maudiozyma humilis]|uniref:Tmc1 protein n=1 Tax=Maudiozyma humilis TaxID=51915 RepID=A0AAV5RPU5_MAUHU|nr:Tmc1 protein [Kazachstania humilis]
MSETTSTTPTPSNTAPSNTTPTPTTRTATSSTKRIDKKAHSKKRKNACYMSGCASAPLKFIGDCQFCHGHFCSKHRIMENHACKGLKTCKEEMHKRNAEKLEKEQTILPKIRS